MIKKKIIAICGILFCVAAGLGGMQLFSSESINMAKDIEKPKWRSQRVIDNKDYVPYMDKYNIRNTDQLGGVVGKYYSRYLDYTVPNGGVIRLLAQDKVTDSQMLYAYSMLKFYLCNLDDKVANSMGENKAVLIMLNGTHGETEVSSAAMIGQELYENEISNIGSRWYMDSNFEHREAAMEEIFHLVHDYGIGTTQNPQAHKELAKKIAVAQQEALPNNKSLWGKEGIWGLKSRDWLNELEKEESLEQEYFVSVLDSYYGLWEAWTEERGGMWGTYIAKTRAEIEEKDPKGYEMITSFLPENINVLMPLDEVFQGTFRMNYDKRCPYTCKSQYLKDIIIRGEKNINIIGNENDNRFIPNSGVNEIDGMGGNDYVQFKGKLDEYEIKVEKNFLMVKDKIESRDGSNHLRNIESLIFTDISLETSSLY